MGVPVVQHSTRRRRARRRRVLWSGGELLVTVGVVLLLLVVHQLWWTNREARKGAERKVEALEREWGAAEPSASPSGTGEAQAAPAPEDTRTAQQEQGANTESTSPSWSQAYAILTIPRLGLRVPVAEGVGKQAVLNKGYVGHYRATQQPGQAGNFALAGHRNTHGEPFRYINRLDAGDTVKVETSSAVYTYTVDKTLDRTSAHDSGVLRRIPRSTVRPAYGYSEPGYYLTLTTCTPEYTSRYRLVVWAKLVATKPR